jgi:hypothetical protein
MPLTWPHQWLERRLLTSGGRKIAYFTIVHNLYSLLAGGFEIALILRLTGSFEKIVFFNLLYYVLLYVAFVAGTFLLRSGKSSRSFRLELGFQAAACAFMMVNFGRLGEPWVLAGFFLLKGTSEGLFWSTRHSALVHCIPDERRDGWSLTLQTVTIVMGLVLPVVSGFVISELVLPMPTASGALVVPVGYFPVYALSATLALAGVVLAPRLRIPSQAVDVRRVVSLHKAPGKASWMAYLLLGAFVSISVTIAVGILNFAVLKTEFNMGLFASWIALASAGFFFGVRKVGGRLGLTRLQMVFAGSLGEFLSRLVFTVFTTVPGLVAKSLLDSFLVPLRSLFGENVIRRRIELITGNLGTSVAEGWLYQESIIFSGRVATCLVLIVLLNFLTLDPVSVARGLLFLLVAYSFVDFNFIRIIDRGNKKFL